MSKISVCLVALKSPLQRSTGTRLAVLTLLLSSLLTVLMSTASTAQAVDFSTPQFRNMWQRADYPVKIGASKRGYTWGPDPFFSSFEPYAETPNGQRRVEYFDKARMEISRPDLNPNSQYYVTNGLVVKEMVTGAMQRGDNSFAQRFPAYDEPVAGDPLAGNPDAATYASFYALATFYNSFKNTATSPEVGPALLDRQPDRINERAVDTISKGGALGRNDLLGSLEGVNYVYYERTLGHNIPKVFWDYLNQNGEVFEYNKISFAKPFDWVTTMGYPISDAYWTRTNVAGVPRDVMVQLYERRILTFTPANTDPLKVEMGNVGRHYFSWRYNAKYDLGIPIQSSAEVKPEAGFPGVTVSMRVFNFIQGEPLSTIFVTPDGRPLVGEIILSPPNQTGFTFQVIYVRTLPSTPPGLYTIYFKGLISGNEAKVYFFVIGIPGFNLPPV